jgi:hypothetical protein
MFSEVLRGQLLGGFVTPRMDAREQQIEVTQFSSRPQPSHRLYSKAPITESDVLRKRDQESSLVVACAVRFL